MRKLPESITLFYIMCNFSILSFSPKTIKNPEKCAQEKMKRILEILYEVIDTRRAALVLDKFWSFIGKYFKLSFITRLYTANASCKS